MIRNGSSKSGGLKRFLKHLGKHTSRLKRVAFASLKSAAVQVGRQQLIKRLLNLQLNFRLLRSHNGEVLQRAEV